jgi:alpha/beta superfamily hydrolase
MELFIDGPEGPLEAIYHAPRGPDGAPLDQPPAVAVVCHPHPAHGGNMHSTVTFRIAKGLERAGVAGLRINFRGVGRSAGRYHGAGGEEGDAEAALSWLAERHPGAALWAAGFSFGSRTVFGLAKRRPDIQRLVLVGFPARAYPLPGVDLLDRPALFIWGAEDEYGNLSDLRAQFPRLSERFEFEELPGSDHFFRRSTKELEERVWRWASAALASNGDPREVRP